MRSDANQRFPDNGNLLVLFTQVPDVTSIAVRSGNWSGCSHNLWGWRRYRINPVAHGRRDTGTFLEKPIDRSSSQTIRQCRTGVELWRRIWKGYGETWDDSAVCGVGAVRSDPRPVS